MLGRRGPSASFEYKLHFALTNLPRAFLHCPSFLRLKTCFPKPTAAPPRWSPARTRYGRTNKGQSPARRFTISRQKESHSPKIYRLWNNPRLGGRKGRAGGFGSGLRQLPAPEAAPQRDARLPCPGCARSPRGTVGVLCLYWPRHS